MSSFFLFIRILAIDVARRTTTSSFVIPWWDEASGRENKTIRWWTEHCQWPDDDATNEN